MRTRSVPPPFFVVRITDASAAPSYQWVEVWDQGAGALVDLTGGRYGGALNPGVAVLGNAFAAGDCALCRQADGNAGLTWELYPVPNGAGRCGTTTTTTTAGPTTTTTPAPCSGTCDWVYNASAKQWLRTGTACGSGCACLAPDFCPSTGACAKTPCGASNFCDTEHTPCVIPPPPPVPCSCCGACEWVWVTDGPNGSVWEWVTGNCTGTNPNCRCDVPQGSGECAQRVVTNCYDHSATTGSPCGAVTTTSPTTSSPGACNGRCLWATSNGSSWDLLLRTCPGCACASPVGPPHGACAQAEAPCRVGPPPTTAAPTTTTTTAAPAPWYCWECSSFGESVYICGQTDPKLEGPCAQGGSSADLTGCQATCGGGPATTTAAPCNPAAGPFSFTDGSAYGTLHQTGPNTWEGFGEGTNDHPYVMTVSGGTVTIQDTHEGCTWSGTWDRNGCLEIGYSSGPPGNDCGDTIRMCCGPVTTTTAAPTTTTTPAPTTTTTPAPTTTGGPTTTSTTGPAVWNCYYCANFYNGSPPGTYCFQAGTQDPDCGSVVSGPHGAACGFNCTVRTYSGGCSGMCSWEWWDGQWWSMEVPCTSGCVCFPPSYSPDINGEFGYTPCAT